MKKLVLLAGIFLAATTGYAQSLEDIRELLGKKDIDYKKAKEMVDKYLSNPKNAAKADGWYYKGYIYNGASKIDSLKSLCDDCKWEAFTAFKKYQELDKKNILMALEQNASLFDLYNGFNEVGVKAYTDKNYALSYNQFKNALDVETYVRSKDFDYNGFKYPATDTLLISYIGHAARNNKQEDTAIKYYKIITGANITGSDYQEIYKFMARHYGEIKDQANFDAAVAQGRKLFPTDPYWTAVEIDFAGNGDKESTFAKYDELLQKTPNDYELSFKYGMDLYKYLNDSKVTIDKAKRETYNDKLVQVLKNTIAIKPTGEANLQMGVYLYNRSYDLSEEADKIKSTKPEDMKKRKALIEASKKMLDESILYCEATNKYYAALPKLEPIDKANYKNSLRMLQNIYDSKNMPAKVDEYEKLSKSLDAK